MGLIAEQVASAPPPKVTPKRSKLDRILDRLDDEDRTIVLDWLHNVDDWSDEDIERKLYDADIGCSDSTIRRWRRIRGLGRG